mgnify:CR=1 FL=1
MHSWHNDMDRALIEPCPSYMLYHFLNSATIKKIRSSGGMHGADFELSRHV